MTDKITIDRAVVEQALDALKYERDANSPLDWHHDKTMTALRAALEQPQVEQEPDAWLHSGGKRQPLYLHPQPPRQPLTELQIFELTKSVLTDGTQSGPVPPIAVRVARAIEAAHGIKEQK